MEVENGPREYSRRNRNIFGPMVGFWIGRKFTIKEYVIKLKEWEKQIREDATKRSRGVLGGKFSEQLAPYLPNFQYDPTDARFIGTPIDLLIFRGLSTGEPEEIVFLEIKSGKGNLSSKERRVRDLINDGKVRWEVYQVPEELTKIQ
jgi:predicted Holliday junction resolvase-like endonuclease